MKNKLLIMVILLGISLAITTHLPAKARTEQTWCYDGSGLTTDPSNYQPCDGPLCPSGTVHVCVIVAPQDSNHPGQPFISIALATRITNRDVSMGDVYLRR
jgi:hypothetical protein